MTEPQVVGTFDCMRCGNRAPRRVVAEYRKFGSNENEKGPFVWEEGNFQELLECPSRNVRILGKGYYHQYVTDEHGSDYEVLYPAAPELIPGLPSGIKSAFVAAVRVKAIDTNASAALLCRVLDMVCFEQN